MGGLPVTAADRWRLPWSPRWKARFLGLLVVLGLVTAGTLYHPPYVILRAGPAIDTLGSGDNGPLVSVSGIRTYPTSGNLDFTTVAQYGGPGQRIDVWDLLRAVLEDEAQVVPRDELYPPDATGAQVKEANQAQMAGSQHAAVAVALRAIGTAERARVAGVASDGPAKDRLRVGDIIVAVDGTLARTTPDVGRLVRLGGDRVRLQVERQGKQSEVLVPTRLVAGRRMIGVVLESVFPPGVSVKINAGQVGGPSAGMMFALAVYDKVTPGELTGGQRIAGTGTIGMDGVVGPIGGIEHKMVGARQAGAAWFLAPSADCAQVRGSVPEGLQVVRVATFDEARTAVAKIGSGAGAELPTCAE